MADTGVRVVQINAVFNAVTDFLEKKVGQVIGLVEDFQKTASKPITHSGLQDVAEHANIMGNQFVQAAQKMSTSSSQVVATVDKIVLAQTKGEEQVQQAKLKTMKASEDLLTAQHKALQSHVDQEVKEHEAGNRRILSDLKVFLAQRKAEWDAADRALKQQEKEQSAATASNRRNPSSGAITNAVGSSLGANDMTYHEKLALAEAKRLGDQEETINQALRNGVSLRIQANAQMHDEVSTALQQARQTNLLNGALDTGLNLRRQTLAAMTSESETLEQVIAREGRITSEMANQANMDRIAAGRGGGGGPGGPPGGGGPPGWPGPPGMGGGFEGALRTVSWGGGVAATVGRLNPAAGAGIAVLGGAFGMAMDAAKGFFGLLTTVAPVALNVVTEGFKLLMSPITGFFGIIGSLKDGVLGFFGELGKGALTLGLAYVGVQTLERALKTLIETTIGFNANLETNHVALGLVMKDQAGVTDRAADIQTEMQNVAIATTFGFEAVQRAVRGLMQGGINVGNVLGDQGLLGVVLDVGSSMGTLAGPAIDHLTLALGQVQQAGHLTGEEMRQLRNAGVNLPEVFAVISRQTGLTVGELTKMQTAGTLTAKMFFDGFKEWGKLNFGGLAKAQANTFSGAMQQIQEAITIVSSRAFKPGFDLMSQALQNFAALVRGPEMLSFAAQMAGRFQAIIDGVMSVVDGFRTGFGFILNIVENTGRVIYNALQWINPFARHSPSLVDSVEDGVQRIIDAYARLGREVPTGVEPLANAMSSFRGVVDAGFNKVDEGLNAKNAKALAVVGPGAPEAYRAVQLAIRDLMDQAGALTPEIIAQTNAVRDLTAEQKDAKRTVDEWTLAVKEAKDEQRGMTDEIKGHRLEILGLNTQILEAKRDYRDWQDTMKPAQDAIDAINHVLDAQNLELDRWHLALKIGEEGLIDLRTASTAAGDHLTHLQDALNLSKDALGGINDQLRMAKAGLKDILEVPLTGTNKYIDQIAAAQTNIAKIQSQIAGRKVSGATDASLKSLNAQLSKAEAILHNLEAKKKIDIDIPEPKLKRLTESGGVEIGFGDKEAQLKAAMAVISPLEQAQRIQQGRVDSQEAMVRGAQAEAHAAKEALDLRNASLDPTRHMVALAQEARDHTQLTRDYMQNQLDIAKEAGKPLQDNIAFLERQKSLSQEALDIVQARLDLDTAERIQPLLDKQEEATRNYDDVNTRLGTANELLTNLKTAQGDLVNLAKAWQGEIDQVLTKANEFIAEQKRNQGGADKFAGGDQDRTAGADEATKKAREQRLALERETALAKGDMAAWMSSWQEEINTSLPWIGGFFGRLTGFVAGVSDAMNAAATGDFPRAKQLFWETLQDVAQGLPRQLTTWTESFVDWVDKAGIAIVRGIGDMVTGMLDFITGKGADDLSGGMQEWQAAMLEWLPIGAQQLMIDLTQLGNDINTWATERVPEYVAKFQEWSLVFWGWVQPIWTPLSKALGDMLLGPIMKWVGDRAKEIGTWVLDNWVTPFFTWVMDEENGAWGKLKPELVKLVWAINAALVGKGDKEDPLYKAGTALGQTLKQGFLNIVGTIVHEIWSAMMDAMGKWVSDHAGEIAMSFVTPGGIIGTIIGKAIADAMGKAIGDKLGEIGKGADRNFRLSTGQGTAEDKAWQAQQQQTGPFMPDRSPGTVQANGTVVPTPTQLPTTSQVVQVPTLDGTEAANNYVFQWEDVLDINSPSKVFQRIGRNVAEGFTMGVDGTLAQWQNPFDKDGSYFSAGAGQKVRGGFSLTGARSITDEPWYLKHKELFPDPTPAGPENPFGPNFANEQRMILAAADKWVNPAAATATDPYPYQAPTPTAGPGQDTSPHSYSYDQGGNPENVTLVLQNSTVVGRGGMDELKTMLVDGLIKSGRLRRLF